jgi:hypothetical protein
VDIYKRFHNIASISQTPQETQIGEAGIQRREGQLDFCDVASLGAAVLFEVKQYVDRAFFRVGL